MRSGRLFWRIYLSFLMVILFSVLALWFYTFRSLSRFYLDTISSELEARTWLLREELQRGDWLKKSSEVDALCKRWGEGTKTRFTVILASGKVIGDSLEDPRKMADHSDRPEVREALLGKVGKSVRFSPTLKEKMLYLALPVEQEGQIRAIVRSAVSVQSIAETVQSIYLRIFLAGLIIALVSGLVSMGLSRGISRPLEELKKGAELFARGDLKYRLAGSGVAEISELAQAMNQMAEELAQRLQELSAQRAEQEAILSGMMEGVIAVDARGNLLSVNQAGARMLGISGEQARGRSIEELVRNPTLQKLLRRTLTEPGPIEGEIVLEQNGEKILQARGAIISDVRGDCLGAVMVLNDITRLKHLERIRREFVANVSHELKTPLSAIQGSVETLLSGAMASTEEAEKFLKMIKTHSERMNAIIEDLLLLARIEQEAEKIGIRLEESLLKRILESAIQSVRSLAEEKSITIELSCPEDLKAKVNPEMLERAVVNLLDNAIKYSDPDKLIKVGAESKGTYLVIIVEDQGWGIAREHLGRIFERFYVVDKSRSRKLGGTGLGLAIVKHIAQAHQGSVSVESEPGKGSKFSIFLPIQ